MDCVKDIGCFPSCNAIKFPYPALETGVHFVVFDWLGTKKTIAFEAVEGEQFYIPNYFNESSDPVFSIKQPSGDYLCWDKELEALAVCPDDCGKDCDFYRHFTLEINQTSGLDGEDIPDYTFSNKVYNIDEAVDNGDGTYTIDVDGAVNGDLAVDDSGTFYEYNDGIWTVKFKEVCAFQDVDTLPDTGEDCALYFQGGKYWAWDGAQFVDVTPIIDFDDIDGLPNLVRSVTGADGIDVDNTDPQNPIVGLDQSTQDSLDLADSAVQPGDNVSDLTNDVGYLTETTHDALPQDNPHGVTASQVGLGNVDNTSDADKPVSTAQGQAINQAEADANQYTDDEITALNLGSASQEDVGDFATAAQGLKADNAIQPGDNLSELNDDTDFLTDVIAGDNITIDKTNPKEPVISGLSAAIPEYVSKSAASGDLNLGLNYPYSIEGDDTAYVKKDTGFISTWDTTQSGVSASDEIALPLVSGGTYNFDVWYGGQLLKTITTYTDNVITFPDGSGTKQIICVGQLEGFRFANGGDKDKILSAEAFGSGFGGTDFSDMFWGCTNLTGVGVLDTSGVTKINYMLRDCTSLTTLDVSTWDVSSVTDMLGVFINLSSLTTLDVSNWDVSSVTRMTNMFFGCTSFTTLDVSAWDVSSVTDIFNIFRGCTSLTTLDVSTWDVSSVTSMLNMFYQCISLTDIPVENWNIENVTNLSDFAVGVTIPTATYDQILTNWSVQNVQPNLSPNFGNSKYSAAGQAGRDDLINNHGWVITDGGLAA